MKSPTLSSGAAVGAEVGATVEVGVEPLPVPPVGLDVGVEPEPVPLPGVVVGAVVGVGAKVGMLDPEEITKPHSLQHVSPV